MSEKMGKEQKIQRFGEKLRTLRTQHGLTLKELAHHFGFSAHSYIVALEAGQKPPSIEFVLGVARLFNVTTDQLLKDELELEIKDARRTLESPSTGQTSDAQHT